MTDNSASKYLQTYIEQTSPLVAQYIERKRQEAASLGVLPEKLIERFFLMLTRGKRIRGALVTLGYRAARGKDIGRILDTSLFIELFQTAALIHEDIMDEDPMRRGLPSFHVHFATASLEKNKEKRNHYGESLAICAGDVGYFLAMEHLAVSSFVPTVVQKAMAMFTNYIIRVGYGQTLDVQSGLGGSMTEQEVLTIYMLKTAEYSGALPLLVGAALAGCIDTKKLDALKIYGMALGWAFQIHDDILGLFGDEKTTENP